MAAQQSNSETTIWQAPELGAALLRGRFTNFSYDVHTHDTACFALLTWGSIRIKMRGSEFVARRGDLYAIDADEPHAGGPVDLHGWSQRTLYVDLNYLRALVGDERVSRSVTLAGPIIRDRALCSTLYGVHRCSQERGPALYREERYLAFAARLLQRHASNTAPPVVVGREDRAVKLARDFLTDHLDVSVHLTDIASAAGLPPYRLFRAFNRATGMTPHGFQRQARVRYAMDLIKSGLALAEVAAAAGFTDQAHLTRHFRRMMGVTPGSYKVAMRAAIRV
ncbi:AraC family transcriptional regulator [Burkholderia sp. L27(2015)]|uniref:helix-turn-helix domain-containing protein n=1 Tax=Burkholderia sp. L27(2015) TaxID=1641858 RepID=UPI00131B275E|nr:AraC family transcriptional regulator [Burkholderia sp. L27(2015)]